MIVPRTDSYKIYIFFGRPQYDQVVLRSPSVIKRLVFYIKQNEANKKYLKDGVPLYLERSFRSHLIIMMGLIELPSTSFDIQNF